MAEIRVISLKDFCRKPLFGDVIFYHCNSFKDVSNLNVIDISKTVFQYLADNVKEFANYIRSYIRENGNDVRIAQSMLFEFNAPGLYANNAFEIIAIKKAIDGLKYKAITLVVPDEYNIELLRTVFEVNYRFRLRTKWIFKFILRNAFYFLCFVPLVKFKKIIHGMPNGSDILVHSFVTKDLRSGYRIDPYFNSLVENLKRKGIKVNRLVSFGEMKVLTMIKSIWALDASEFVFPESYLGLIETIRSFLYCYSVKNTNDLRRFRFDSCDLTSYMKALSVYMAVCCLNFRFDLMRKIIRNGSINALAIIVQNESYFYQRALFKESNSGIKKILRIGYQTASIPSYMPNNYYGIFHKKYDPDIIFTSGKFFKEYLTGRLEYPESLIKIGCSLNNIPQGRKYRKSKKPILCVYVDLYYTEAMAIKKYMEGTLLNGGSNFDVGIRFHPYISKDLISLFRHIKHFEYSSADESLTKSDCFLSAGISTINLSAALTGKPVYLLDIPNMPRWFDCYYMDNLKYIKPNELVPVDFFSEKESINEDTGVSLDETCEEIIRLMSDKKTNGCHTKQEYVGVDESYSPPPFQTII